MGCSGSKSGVTEAHKKESISAFKSADELTDFSTFFKKDTSSALSRNLTQEIWDEYKDQKDSCGVSFKTCIFSGIKNLDSGIGLYAGSEDSYTKFSKLFDKVVEEYHKHKPTDNHVSDMDASKLKNCEFSEAEAAMVNSTRIRVGRNCAEYPLGPGIT
jgi:creatine kinase